MDNLVLEDKLDTGDNKDQDEHDQCQATGVFVLAVGDGSLVNVVHQSSGLTCGAAHRQQLDLGEGLQCGDQACKDHEEDLGRCHGNQDPEGSYEPACAVNGRCLHQVLGHAAEAGHQVDVAACQMAPYGNEGDHPEGTVHIHHPRDVCSQPGVENTVGCEEGLENNCADGGCDGNRHCKQHLNGSGAFALLVGDQRHKHSHHKGSHKVGSSKLQGDPQHLPGFFTGEHTLPEESACPTCPFAVYIGEGG